MPDVPDSITLSFPRTALPDIVALSQTLRDRMHELLERNAEGQLTAIEREEAEILVAMAQFGQIVALSLRSADPPQANRLISDDR
ncbi:MAG: hypothetical protein WD042_06170 [Phycisphaeraceae bacterium]